MKVWLLSARALEDLGTLLVTVRTVHFDVHLILFYLIEIYFLFSFDEQWINQGVW